MPQVRVPDPQGVMGATNLPPVEFLASIGTAEIPHGSRIDSEGKPIGTFLDHLTGTEAQIAKVAKDFVVIYNPEKAEGASDYLVSHSRTPYLFDRDGKPVALVPVDDPSTPNMDEGAPDKVQAFLDKWIK